MRPGDTSERERRKSVASFTRGANPQRGFTLIEMLVVLVLTAIVVGIVFEGLGRVADLRVRLARHLDGALDETISGSWFRGSVAALQPDYINAPDAFRGGATEMSGLTLRPIDLPAGAATPFAWRLLPDASGTTRLSYRGADQAWREVASWTGAGARFLYAGPDGEWRSDWPPPLSGGSTPLGSVVSRDRPQLPRFVKLESGGAENRTIAASVLGSTLPRIGTSDLLRALR
jgi:prepilin-type N-terminal cleavage/methylation domain-containing protein